MVTHLIVAALCFAYAGVVAILSTEDPQAPRAAGPVCVAAGIALAAAAIVPFDHNVNVAILGAVILGAHTPTAAHGAMRYLYRTPAPPR